MAEVLAASKPSDWRALDPENTLYLDLPAGRVVIALAPAFAPRHVANVKALVREGYFDGLAILRAQDNYVVQWGDPNGDDTAQRRPIQKAQRTLGAEFDRPMSPDLPFTRLPDVAAAAGFWGRIGATLTTLEFDSLAKIGRVDAPVLMLHGSADKTVR